MLLQQIRAKRVNNGVIFAVPNTTFGNLWWLGLKVNKFYCAPACVSVTPMPRVARRGRPARASRSAGWDYHSCSWPGEYELRHRSELQIATSMRILPYSRWDNGSWTDQLEVSGFRRLERPRPYSSHLVLALRCASTRL